MSTNPDTDIRRLRTIGVVLSVLRCVLAVAPIWIAAAVFAHFSPDHASGFESAAGWLTCALLVATIIRQVSTYWIVGPDHVFLRDARRVTAWLDKPPAERTITFGLPSELLVLKAINLVLLFIRWGLFLGVAVGGFRYIWTALVDNQPVPDPVGTLAQWSLAGVFVFAIGFAIAGGMKIIRSSTVADFPNTRSLLGRSNT